MTFSNQGEADRYNHSEIGKKFREVVKGTNFITPYFDEYRQIKDYIVEITSGTGMNGTPIYGITIVQGNSRRLDLDTCVFSKQEIEDYLTELIEIE